MNNRDSEDDSEIILSRSHFSTPVNNTRPLFAVSPSPNTLRHRRQTLEVFRTPGFSSNQTSRRTLLITPTNTPEQHGNGQTPSIFRTPGFSQGSTQSRNSLLLTPTNMNQRVPFTPAVRNYELRSCRGSTSSLFRQVPEIPTPKKISRQDDPSSPWTPGSLLFVPQMGAGGDTAVSYNLAKLQFLGKLH